MLCFICRCSDIIPWRRFEICVSLTDFKLKHNFLCIYFFASLPASLFSLSLSPSFTFRNLKYTILAKCIFKSDSFNNLALQNVHLRPTCFRIITIMTIYNTFFPQIHTQNYSCRFFSFFQESRFSIYCTRLEEKVFPVCNEYLRVLNTLQDYF